MAEGMETMSEQTMRERKDSLLALFNALGLKPRVSNAFLRDGGAREKPSNIDDKVLRSLTQGANSLNIKDAQHAKDIKGKAKAKQVSVEVIGDGEHMEEVEAEGEELSDNDLKSIYRKYVPLIFVWDQKITFSSMIGLKRMT